MSLIEPQSTKSRFPYHAPNIQHHRYTTKNTFLLSSKLSAKSEWEKTKDFQKKSWAEAKNQWPWNQIFKGKDNE